MINGREKLRKIKKTTTGRPRRMQPLWEGFRQGLPDPSGIFLVSDHQDLLKAARCRN
jgi:hypothetical protein